MIYPMVPFPGHGAIFMPIDALSVLCAQLTRDLLAIAKFLLFTVWSAVIDLFLAVAEPYNPCSCF